VKPADKVLVKYLTPSGNFAGFSSPNLGKAAAEGQLSQGADVIYSAAGSSGNGAIEAIAAKPGAWAIGVDSDQYTQPGLAKYKASILTSAVKNVDIAVYDFIKSVSDGQPLTGTQTFNLAKGGVGLATSGGFIDDIKTQLDAATADITSGKVTVPTTTSRTERGSGRCAPARSGPLLPSLLLRGAPVRHSSPARPDSPRSAPSTPPPRR
jgi:basic membrane protein A